MLLVPDALTLPVDPRLALVRREDCEALGMTPAEYVAAVDEWNESLSAVSHEEYVWRFELRPWQRVRISRWLGRLARRDAGSSQRGRQPRTPRRGRTRRTRTPARAPDRPQPRLTRRLAAAERRAA